MMQSHEESETCFIVSIPAPIFTLFVASDLNTLHQRFQLQLLPVSWSSHYVDDKIFLAIIKLSIENWMITPLQILIIVCQDFTWT